MPEVEVASESECPCPLSGEMEPLSCVAGLAWHCIVQRVCLLPAEAHSHLQSCSSGSPRGDEGLRALLSIHDTWQSLFGRMKC